MDYAARALDAPGDELEHRHLDRFGARRDEMRRVFDQEGDWGKLGMFARVATAVS